MQELGFIFASFEFLPQVITRLQGRLSLVSQFDFLNKVLGAVQGDKYKEQLDSVLVRNLNFKQLTEISLILRGEKLSTTDVKPLDAAIFRNASMVSVDIERVFSSMGKISLPREWDSQLRTWNNTWLYIGTTLCSKIIEFLTNFFSACLGAYFVKICACFSNFAWKS